MAIARGFLAATAPPPSAPAPAPCVVLATDDCNSAVARAAAAAAGLLGPNACFAGRFELQSFPPEAAWAAADRARFEVLHARAATVVAIERAGPAADGGCYTMRGLDMAPRLAPLHRLLSPRGRPGLPLQSVHAHTRLEFVGAARLALLLSLSPSFFYPLSRAILQHVYK